jgi:hypothetical protein
MSMLSMSMKTLPLAISFLVTARRLSGTVNRLLLTDVDGETPKVIWIWRYWIATRRSGSIPGALRAYYRDGLGGL